MKEKKSWFGMLWQDHQYINKSSAKHQSLFPTLKDTPQKHPDTCDCKTFFRALKVEKKYHCHFRKHIYKNVLTNHMLLDTDLDLNKRFFQGLVHKTVSLSKCMDKTIELIMHQWEQTFTFCRVQFDSNHHRDLIVY